METFPYLSVAILFPIAAAFLIPFLPDPGDGSRIRWYALTIALADFLVTVAAFLNGYDPAVEGLQLVERVNWLPELGLGWSVGADGLSMPLILLTTFITSLAILAAWPVTFKPRLFHVLMLAMCGGQVAAFAVQDMLLFFLAWELELIPVYLLLAIWGERSGNTQPPSSSSTPPVAPCSSWWQGWPWAFRAVVHPALPMETLLPSHWGWLFRCFATWAFSLPGLLGNSCCCRYLAPIPCSGRSQPGSGPSPQVSFLLG